MDKPVLNLPEIKTLAAWALDCGVTQMLAAGKQEAFEKTCPLYLGSDGGVLIKGENATYFDTALLGPALRPILKSATSAPFGYLYRQGTES